MKSQTSYHATTTMNRFVVLLVGIMSSLSLWSLFWASYQAAHQSNRRVVMMMFTDTNNNRAVQPETLSGTTTITTNKTHSNTTTVSNSVNIRTDVPNKNSLLAHDNTRNTTSKAPLTITVSKTDLIMRRGPFVLEKYKLIFFPVTKVACTAFKILLRRMQGFHDWNLYKQQAATTAHTNNNGIHSTRKSGLKPLKLYSQQQALHMMTAPDWTRAIFVRDPKERLLSAYLDKAVKNSWYVKGRCCSGGGVGIGGGNENNKNNETTGIDVDLCMKKATGSLQGFLDTIQTCLDIHWIPQTYRMDQKYWEYINFVGHLENGTADTKRLLEKLGVWEEYGASGWGPHGNVSFLDPAASAGREHATNAVQLLKQHYTSPVVERAAEAYYKIDYDNPYLGLSRKNIFDD